MNTSPGTAVGPRLKRALIIARTLCVTCAVVALVACSAVRLAYNQAPGLAYWWVDGYADLNDPQSVQLRRDIDAFFAWHRVNELPFYVTRLQQWQRLVASDSTPELVCMQFEHLRAAYLRMVDRGLEPMARLALTTTPAQLQHMQRQFAKGNKKFETDFVRVNAEERVETLLERATDRYETVYGDLTTAQIQLLRERIRLSPFDAQRIHTERLRRQSDLLKTLRDLQAERGTTTAAAGTALRAWHDRVMQSPVPGAAPYNEALVRNGCEQWSAVHNTTTPEQRTHAVRVLKDYETDLRALVTEPH